MAYETVVKNTARAIEPAEGSRWGKFHEDTAWRTEGGNSLSTDYSEKLRGDS
jgi:hypothetical protein